jgi:Sulfotransferase family
MMGPKATKASEAVDALAKKAAKLFATEEAKAALALVDEGLDTEPHARLWRLKARLLMFFEREAEATSILQRVLPTVWHPGFWELILSGLPQSYALLSEDHKLAYFPVRKCSSTSLHNVMAILNGGAARGEDIHDNVVQYNLVDRAQDKGSAADYFRFLLVRSPVDRVRSFYQGNIAGRDHLVRDSGGRDSFYGLKTKPSYEEFLDKFEAYRRTFLTVRNHTDPLSGFVGTDIGLFNWIGGVPQTNELIKLLADRTGVKLPQRSDMRSGTQATSAVLTATEQALLPFYRADYDTFGNWF